MAEENKIEPTAALEKMRNRANSTLDVEPIEEGKEQD